MILHSFCCYVLLQLHVPEVVQQGVTFTNLMMRYESLLITSATWVIIQAVHKGLNRWGNSPVFVRAKPALAVAISVGLAFLPSFRLGMWDETLLYGITLGSLTGLGQKLIKQTLMGRDHRIKPFIKDPELREKIDEYLKNNEESQKPVGIKQKLAKFLS